MSDPRNAVIYRIHDAALEQAVRRYGGGRLIDIGCGKKPYKALLQRHIKEHVGVDRAGGLHGMDAVDLVGTAYEIPAPDASFDTAMCTAVLEHLEEPSEVLAECFRVLKSDGYAIYSVPFIWHLHEEPRDFYRYSKYGLRYLFEKAGFEVVELKALSGFWVTFGTLFLYNLYRFNRGPIRRWHALDPMGRALGEVAHGLDRLDRTEQWTWMYLVVARKP